MIFPIKGDRLNPDGLDVLDHHLYLCGVHFKTVKMEQKVRAGVEEDGGDLQINWSK